jgi:hypothetical protein
MKLYLKSKFSLCNQGGDHSEYDDLMVRGIYTKILLDESDKLSEEELECGDDRLTEIGKIICHRLDLRYSESDLAIVADCQSPDLQQVASYFFHGEGKNCFDDFFPNAIYYIDNVIIKPEYRGHDYGLYALALLLEAIAHQEIVVCHPSPIDENSTEKIGNNGVIIHYQSNFDSEEKRKAQKILKRYWSKLGLEYYDENYNLLWQPEWELPQWLRKKLFNESADDLIDISDEDPIDYYSTMLNSDTEQINQDDLKMQETDLKARRYYDFCEFLQSKPVSSILGELTKHYYDYDLENLVENFDADSVSQFLQGIFDAQGKPMFTQEDIDTLVDAQKFALSDDPNKRVKYRCTIEIDLDEPIKITPTVEVNCISNDYLKIVPTEDEDYTTYLIYAAEAKFREQYPELANAILNSGSTISLADYKILDE